MATAGDRYEERTGNIWSYCHRGDISGLRAALARGVSPDMQNTVGWTPAAAAAAGGQTKVLRLLAKCDADFTITDRGGNLPVHQAALNGQVHALRVLSEYGADVTKVRLSQAKGKATRDFVLDAYKKAGKSEADDDFEEDAPVGYARKQAKSNAFFGPRRTPISTKIKKRIIKEKRLKKKEKSARKYDKELMQNLDCVHDESNDTSDRESKDDEPSYIETVRLIKRNKNHRRKQKQFRKGQANQAIDQDEDSISNDKDEEESGSLSCDDESVVSDDEDSSLRLNGFAALDLGSESDSDSGSE